jgi:4-amino-4-deoxy-L-arabinose transferase-like glycosyltransferase
MEEGAGVRVIRYSLLALGLVAVLTVYAVREFRNFSNPEAMDLAQLARNIADGRGFVTDNVRPFSLHLVQTHRADRDVRLRGGHPDLANAPLYPLLLAGWMKVLPFDYQLPPFGGAFGKYQPELLIAGFNQLLFFVAAWMVLRLGCRLFDARVGWTAAAILVGTDLFWRFSAAGTPTMLLLVIFLGAVWSLVRLDEGARIEQRGLRWALLWSALIGLLLGLGALTRYSFGWLILPVLFYLLRYLKSARLPAVAVVAVVFAAVLTPWLMRNYHWSGTLFGVAGYAIHEETYLFPDDRLPRSLNPDFSKAGFQSLRIKLVTQVGSILEHDLPKLGGSWLTSFFLVGLMMPFRRLTLSHLRLFTLIGLGVMVVVQALGRSHLSTLAPDVNSENLLVLLAPLMFLFGVAMFYLLLDQMRLPFPELRHVVVGGFLVVVCAPFLLTLLPPRTQPIAYPPYYPPIIQETAGWTAESELMMSDVPWAVAWYGRRQCVGLTLDIKTDFVAINDYHKPIKALYLTPVTLDGKLMTQMLSRDGREWGFFVLDNLFRREVPAGFPLKVIAPGLFPQIDQAYVTDYPRWKNWPRQ